MLTVAYCFCGCSLRLGTLIIFHIFAVFFSINFLSSTYESGNIGVLFLLIDVIPNVSAIITSIIGIYGVYKGKSEYLIPFLGYAAICMVPMIVILFVLSLGGKPIVTNLPAELNAMKNRFALIVIGAEIIIFIILALLFYVFIVVRSFYLESQKEPQKELQKK